MSIPDELVLQRLDENFDWRKVKDFENKKVKIGEQKHKFLCFEWSTDIKEYAQTPRKFFNACIDEAKKLEAKKGLGNVRLTERIYTDTGYLYRLIWKDDKVYTKNDVR